jgi:hypothetical protein
MNCRQIVVVFAMTAAPTPESASAVSHQRGNCWYVRAPANLTSRARASESTHRQNVIKTVPEFDPVFAATPRETVLLPCFPHRLRVCLSDYVIICAVLTAALGHFDPRSHSNAGRPAAVAQIITRSAAHSSSPADTRESLLDFTARCAPSRYCSLRCAPPCTVLSRHRLVGIDSHEQIQHRS